MGNITKHVPKPLIKILIALGGFGVIALAGANLLGALIAGLIAIVIFGAVSIFFYAALLKVATRTAFAVEAKNAHG